MQESDFRRHLFDYMKETLSEPDPLEENPFLIVALLLYKSMKLLRTSSLIPERFAGAPFRGHLNDEIGSQLYPTSVPRDKNYISPFIYRGK